MGPGVNLLRRDSRSKIYRAFVRAAQDQVIQSAKEAIKREQKALLEREKLLKKAQTLEREFQRTLIWHAETLKQQM